jgi:hypothetical protein
MDRDPQGFVFTGGDEPVFTDFLDAGFCSRADRRHE